MSDVSRQAKQHLDALKAAGVDHVPVPPPRPTAVASESLFAAPVDTPPDDRRRELSVLAADVAKCDRCPELFSTRTQTVFGVGRLSPDICFVGEAPGADEDRTGEPFVGAAGQLLTKIITAMGLTRDDVYICNTLKCRPPRNRPPAATELSNCRGYFDRQLELVAPKTICCLGATAAQHVLGVKSTIGRLRGKFHDLNGTPVLCTFHPSYLLRLEGMEQQRAKAGVWEEMKTLLRKVGRPIPGGK